MMKWVRTLALATIVTLAGASRFEAAAASSRQASGSVPVSVANAPTESSARRHVHRHHRYYRYGYRPSRYGYGPYYPRYYARPYYYEPDPYFTPAPFGLSFGFGFGPGW
jgi:hypothetical protein